MTNRMTCTLLLLIVLLPGPARCGDPVYQRWEDAVSLRGQRQYEAAESVLRGILADYPDQDELQRRAWSEIIFTLMLGGDLAAEDQAAREALLAYPDLEADTLYIPETVNDLLEATRRRMYGSIRIREPEGAAVFLDGADVGAIPLMLPYVEVGRHELRVTRENHDDYLETVEVAPEGRHLFEKIDLKRQKNTSYWLTRIGAGALAVGTVALIAGQGSSDTAPEPLAGPPDLPASR